MNVRMRTGFVVVLAIVGLSTAALFWQKAFPIASVDFQFSKREIENRMEEWIQGQGISLSGYYRSLLFHEKTNSKNYIELELGLAPLEDLTRRGLSLWDWEGRWFRPEQEEEFQIALDPLGRLVYYHHQIEETKAMPSLTQTEARVLAEKFLQKEVLQHPLHLLRFIEDSSDKKPKRTDYIFTWERTDLRAKDAPYRVEVTIQGDRVGGYTEYLKIPEAWTRDFEGKYKTNEFFETIATYALYPVLIGGFVLFIVYLYQRKLRWKDSIPRSWFLIFGLVTLASSINELPVTIAWYDTTEKWGSYLMGVMSDSLLESLEMVGMVWFLAVMVDPLYRESFPQHLPFHVSFSLKGLRYQETLRAIALGTAFACFSLGYVTLFYVLGKPLGVWSPVEIDYSKTLSGWLPWIEPLHVGLTASFGEEMIFRALSILLYQKIFRLRWLAVLLSAMTWAFLHSTYPQMPGYIRGIELTVEGVIWGVLMIRFGLLAPLVAHYLYDCWLGSLILFQSADWMNCLGALAVSSWPILLGLWGWLKYQKAGVLSSYLEQTESPSETERLSPEWFDGAATPWLFAQKILSFRSLGLLLMGSLSLLLVLYWIPSPNEDLDRLGRLVLSRFEISKRADEELRKLGHYPEEFRKIISLSANRVNAKYLLEHRDLDDLAALYGKEWPDLEWHIRYFRFGEPEEFTVVLDKEGKFLTWNHEILQEAPGASLEKEEAYSLARRELESRYGVNLENEELVSDNVLQQQNRRDYDFVFKRLNWNWGESELRTSIEVQGNEIMNFQRYVKIPEAWFRAQALSGWKEALIKQSKEWLSVGKVVFFFCLFVLLLRKKVIPWGTGLLIGIIPTTLQVFNWFNELPWFYQGYSTETPISYFIAQGIGDFVVSVALDYLKNSFSAGVVLGLMNWAFGWTIADLVIWPAHPEARRSLWFHSTVLTMIGICIWEVQSTFRIFWSGWLFPDRIATFFYPNVLAIFPWLSSLLHAFSQGYEALISIAFKAAGAVILYRRFPKTVWCLLFLAPLYGALDEKSWEEFFYSAIWNEIQWLTTLLLVWKIWRFNALAIFLAYALSSLWSSMELFLTKGGPYYQWQVVPLIAIATIVGLAVSFSRRGTHMN